MLRQWTGSLQGFIPMRDGHTMRSCICCLHGDCETDRLASDGLSCQAPGLRMVRPDSCDGWHRLIGKWSTGAAHAGRGAEKSSSSEAQVRALSPAVLHT